MRIEGENANEKALELSGTDVGGWTAIVKAAPWQKEVMDPWCPASAAAARPKEHSVNVTGYDTSLPEIDIEMAVCEFLSSCGEVARIMVLPSHARVSIIGEGCVDKALQLSGCNVGGITLEVKPVVLVKINRSTDKTG
ncbi:nucleolin 2 [Arabidopsis lyrata subsp. lyrata]|nr:nucleolin 2 [Arabidopsis lyrata subsp. lyrata]|eukprot:XP_020881372.1 nucleolin 2 [Arabidopsis lyrata subsp. lyrata]